jgi:hypothetical protein
MTLRMPWMVALPQPGGQRAVERGTTRRGATSSTVHWAFGRAWIVEIEKETLVWF